MLKKTIEFVDYFGNPRKQDFYFNLTKSELMEMELYADGGLERLIEKIIQTQDNKRLVEYFKEIIFKSYGEKSEDGTRFIKSVDLSIAFSQTPAYDKLFMELATDAEKASEFINGIVPEDISKQLKEEQSRTSSGKTMNPALAAVQNKTVPLAIPKSE